MGRCVGRDAIRDWFKGAADIFSFAVHYSLNGQIHVDGDRAEAQWYLFMPCVMKADGRAWWRASIDQERYVRVGEEWLFSYKGSKKPLFHTPFDEGWARRASPDATTNYIDRSVKLQFDHVIVGVINIQRGAIPSCPPTRSRSIVNANPQFNTLCF